MDHEVLIRLLSKRIQDENALWLLREIIQSFHHEETPGKGLPIGNLTSQIFTNVYLNELDQFVKHVLRIKYYLRYADDFLLLSSEKKKLEKLLPLIRNLLNDNLKLELHPQKIDLRPLHQGVDFLGYVTLPFHRILRTKTKRRMMRRLSEKQRLISSGELVETSFNQALQSYLGMLSHANAHHLQETIRNAFSMAGRT